ARSAQRPGRRARRQVRVRAKPRRRHQVSRAEGPAPGAPESRRAGQEARDHPSRGVPLYPADPGCAVRQAVPQPQPPDPRALPSRVPHRRGFPRIDGGREGADLRADNEGSAGSAQGRGDRELRRKRARALPQMVGVVSRPRLLTIDGYLFRQAAASPRARAHRVASHAAHPPADADSRIAEYRTRPQADRGRPRRPAAPRQGLGRRKGGSMKKTLIAFAAAALSIAAHAQQRNFDAVQIKTTKVSEGIYMLEGEGGNIGVSAGEDG